MLADAPFVCCGCGRPAAALLVAYARGLHARVPDCAGCGWQVDPYVERDSLLLLLDLLLVRAGALRHVLINRPALAAAARARAPRLDGDSGASCALSLPLPRLWKVGVALLALDTYSAVFYALAPARAPRRARPTGHTAHAALPWRPVDALQQHGSMVALLASASSDACTQALLQRTLALDRPWLLPHLREAAERRNASGSGASTPDGGADGGPCEQPVCGGLLARVSRASSAQCSSGRSGDVPCERLATAAGPSACRRACERLVWHCAADRCTVPTRVAGDECESPRAAAAAAICRVPSSAASDSSGGDDNDSGGNDDDDDDARARAAVSPHFAHLLRARLPPGAASGDDGGADAAPHSLAARARGRLLRASAAALHLLLEPLHLFVLAVGACVAAEWLAYALVLVAVAHAAAACEPTCSAQAPAASWAAPARPTAAPPLPAPQPQHPHPPPPPPPHDARCGAGDTAALRHPPLLRRLLPALLLASHGKLLLLPTMVWPYPRAVTVAIDVYVCCCHAAALHWGCGLPAARAGCAVAAGAAGALAAKAALHAAALRPLQWAALPLGAAPAWLWQL